ASAEVLEAAVIPATREVPVMTRPIVYFDKLSANSEGFEAHVESETLSVRKTLGGKNVMLIGVTGFIGKVWLVNTLMDLPEIGRIYMLIRRQKSNPALRRFGKLMTDSTVLDQQFA